jgi:hypothetical protein
VSGPDPIIKDLEHADIDAKPVVRDELGRIVKGSGSLHPGGHYRESADAKRELAKYVQGSVETLGKLAQREIDAPIRVQAEAAKFIIERFVGRADPENGPTENDNLQAIKALFALIPKS